MKLLAVIVCSIYNLFPARLTTSGKPCEELKDETRRSSTAKGVKATPWKSSQRTRTRKAKSSELATAH